MDTDAISDSDAPEEFTTEEGIRQDEEIRKLQKDNILRAAHENKERRRQWAQRKTQPKSKKGVAKKTEDIEQPQEKPNIPGMLPDNIVNLLAAREKQIFNSDSEEEIIDHKPSKKKKRKIISGSETVLLSNIPPPECIQNSLEFLKRRKMQVARSTAVLKNANQALRLLSSKGSLLSQS